MVVGLILDEYGPEKNAPILTCSCPDSPFLIVLPWLEGDKEMLEKVQKRLVRLISDKRGNSYEERLESVGLTTLTERRQRGDMIEAFKTLNGFNRATWFLFQNADSNRATRSTVSIAGDEERQRNNVLYKERVCLETRKNFFSVRVVDQWNLIPDEIKEQKSVNGFKNRYDEWTRATRHQQQQ